MIDTTLSDPPARRRHTIREATIAGLREEMEADESVILIGQDIGVFNGPLACTEGLYDQFGPKRVIQTAVSESAMISLALGAAAKGLRPIVDIMFSDMLPLIASPLIQTAAPFRYLMSGRGSLPVVIRTRGGDGPYRAHPQNFEALFAHSPGMTVVQPSRATDAYDLIRASVASNDPVIYLENIYLYNAFKDDLQDERQPARIGSATVVSQGRDVTAVGYGRSVRTLMNAVAECEAKGISLEVVDLRTVHPWDSATIEASVAKTGRLIVAHEAWARGGMGDQIVSHISRTMFGQLRASPAVLGAPDIPIPWAPRVRDAMSISSAAVVDVAVEIMRRSER
ncbi:alpha-ketoacid dehydrogenase subunit beta [Nocardioides humi]|uniref:Alpha-ketoacid dehydrogenase subunit beta n=1 Tax=Nocardioides humi TaxID=449461 RepID=A0ABN2AGU4_9ACTN|nr:transketolase C-terminal domain-containing protein [Nocardioides humi]